MPRNEIEVVTEGGELVNVAETPSALEAMTRAEIDVQISTAKRFPRSLTKFMANAKSMVALDPDLAAECTYCLPARKGSEDNKPISGPSVRLSEIVAACYGNLRIVGRIASDDGKTITAQAVAHDLEQNVTYGIEVQRGVTTYRGRRFSEDMVRVTANAALAIATRNAVFKVVPRAFVNLIQMEAATVARGDVRSLPDRTAKAVDWFAGKGIDPERVYATLGIEGAADMTLDLLQQLNGYRTAVNEGTATLEELFPVNGGQPKQHAQSGESRAAALTRKIGGLTDEEARQEFGTGADA